MKRGFTLIEILVVVGIIAVLAVLAVPNFLSAREKARDAQRKSDLRQIQNALELYKDDQNPVQYPASITYGSPLTSPDGNTTYMKEVPGDPIGTYQYDYVRGASGLTYTLTACLENKADPQGDICKISCSTGSKCFVLTEP